MKNICRDGVTRCGMAILAILLVVCSSFVPAAPVSAQPGPLGSEFRVNTTTYGGQGVGGGVDADFTLNGEFVVVWRDSGGYLVGLPSGGGGVGMQRFSADGVPRGTEGLVSTTVGQDSVASTGVAVASADDGSFLVVWQNGDSPTDDVVGRRFGNNGLPLTGEFSILPGLTEPYLFTRLAMDKDGAFVVAWPGLDTDSGGVKALRFDTGTSPLGTEFVVNTYTTGDQGGAGSGTYSAIGLDMHSDGDFVVAWKGPGVGDPDTGVFAQRFASGGTPNGTEFRVNSYTTGGQGVYGGVAVKYGDGGDFVVVWGGYGSGGIGVFGQRFDSSGATEGTEFRIDSGGYGASLYGPLDIAVTDSDGFVVAWPGKGLSDDDDINLRYFDADGDPQGIEFLAHLPTGASGPHQGDRRDLALASGNGSRFVVAWGGDAYDVGGSYRDVFARQFLAPSGTILTVTKTADTNDGVCDTDCSLREAIIAANTLPGTQEIDLGAGIYDLTLPGLNEDASATGDLDITDSLKIVGAGVGGTVIDANGLDRAFDLFVSGGDATFIGMTIRNGFASTDGGGIRVTGAGLVAVAGSTVESSTAQDSGGGIFADDDADLTVVYSTVVGNQAVNGVGGGVRSGRVTVISRSTISGNTAPAGGGIENSNSLTVSSSTVNGNTATPAVGEGGGIWNSGWARIVNSTISTNSADDTAGGICNESSGLLVELFNTTIVDNTSTNSGGGLGCLHAGLVKTANTVFGGNAPDSCVSGTTLSGGGGSGANGHNVDDDGSCGLAETGDQSNVATVGLGPLADNGGKTWTHAVLVGSPLIGAGDSTVCGVAGTFGADSDQRGYLRDPACDVGAHELGASCGGDNDGDGICNPDDNCPNTFNPDQRNSDGAGGGDLCDVCPSDGSDGCDLGLTGADVLDSTGGSVTSADGMVSLTVPAGVLTTPTSVSITGTDSPNFYVGGSGASVATVKLEPEGVVFAMPITLRLGWLDEEAVVSVCSMGDGFDDTFNEDESLFKIWRNGVAITTECNAAACEPGTVCTAATCDACANEWLVDITEFSEYTVPRLTAPAQCPETASPSCAGSAAVQAKLDVSEKTAGREKVKLQWKRIAGETTQGGFGDPVTGNTGVALCVYDDVDALVQDYLIDRAGQLCAGKDCWRERGTTGYGYKDKESSADGVSKIQYKAGSAGKGKASALGKNNSAKGQISLPTGVVAKLTGNTAPTIQFITTGGFCTTATMNEVKKDDATRYSARLK